MYALPQAERGLLNCKRMQSNTMNKENISAVGQDILLSGRTQLCLALPYMSGPLCALILISGDETTVSAATDGETLYYNASFLAAGFLKSER